MKAVVRSILAVLPLLAMVSVSSSAHGQVTATAPVSENPTYTNRWDVDGGFQYSHFNPSPGRNINATNLFGWTGGATAWMRPVWGIESSVRGVYGNMNIPENSYNVPTSAKMSETLFLFGPTFRLMRHEKYAAGMHVLIGAAYGSFDKDFPSGVQPNTLDIYNNKLAFGAAVGGWYDHNLSQKLAVRLTTDWQPTRYGYSEQNEFAGSVGIVYRLGSLTK
ncbi:hypothetical protein [Silvibacterium sp.]|uniref:hypothetical protein n=1 Tax=Silvibacterium sp. TaxID=1964179 RepID=UPI0039E548C8